MLLPVLHDGHNLYGANDSASLFEPVLVGSPFVIPFKVAVERMSRPPRLRDNISRSHLAVLLFEIGKCLAYDLCGNASQAVSQSKLIYHNVPFFAVSSSSSLSPARRSVSLRMVSACRITMRARSAECRRSASSIT